MFLTFTPYSNLFNEYLEKSIEIAENGESISMDDLNPAFMNYSQFINIVTMIVFGLYSAYMETTAKRGTFGKSVLKIGVGDFIGKPISGEIAFKRNVLKIITLSIFPLLGLWFIFDSKNRGLHDLFSKTLIVSLKNENFKKKN